MGRGAVCLRRAEAGDGGDGGGADRLRAAASGGVQGAEAGGVHGVAADQHGEDPEACAAGAGAGLRRYRATTFFATSPPTPHPAMLTAIGTAVPSSSAPTSHPETAPSPNCSVPISAEALPATLPCGPIARVVASGMVAPIFATKTNSNAAIAQNPPQPVAAATTSASPAPLIPPIAKSRAPPAGPYPPARALAC